MSDDAAPHDHDDLPAVSFDDRAATWDDEATVARARYVADEIIRRVVLGPDTRLLEYGAGTGLVAEALRDSVGPIVLADTSQGMRKEIRRKVADGRLAGARIWDSDFSKDDVPRGEVFDVLVTSMVLHHVDPLAPTLRAFHALLVPGGRLCAVDLEAEDGSFHGTGVQVHHGFDRGDLATQLRDAGFAEVVFSDCGTVDRDGVPFALFLAVATA